MSRARDLLPPRQNPFRSSRIESLAFRFTEGLELSDLIEKFTQLGYRGALVGPKGSGKTTLLELMQREHRRRGWQVLALHSRPGEPPLSALPVDRDLAETLITVDGAEQLGFLERLRLSRDARQAGGLLVTCHQPLTWIPTLHRHRTGAELFISLTHELLERGALPCPWSEARLKEIFDLRDGNIREAFRHLFDEAAAHPQLAKGSEPDPKS